MGAFWAMPTAAQTQTPQPDLEQRVDQLDQELRELRQQLQTLRNPDAAHGTANAQPALEQRLDQLDQEIHSLREQLAAQRAAPAAQPAAAAAGNEVKLISNGRNIKFISNDGATSFQVGGRIQTDYAHYHEDKQPLGDGTGIRGARLSGQGTVYSVWDYRVEYDFSDSKANPTARGIRDAYVSYTGFKPLLITVGNFKEPFSLEQLIYDIEITFMERSLIDIFAPARHVGVTAQTSGTHWSLAGGVYGERPEDDVINEGDEGYDLTGRATWAPWSNMGRVLHLGAAVRHHEPKDSTNQLRFASRPESNITDVQLVNTGALVNAGNFTSYGLEAAGEWGPWLIQAEYMDTQVKRNSMSDLSLDGWYVTLSWFLTGESRPYKPAQGIFGRVTPKGIVGQGGGGGWELALRLSQIDLNDKDVHGGRERNLTAGLNWHLTPNVKLMANYIKVLTLNRPNYLYDGDKPSAYTMRAQLDF